MGPGVYFALCFLGCLAFSHAEEGAKDQLLPRPRAPCPAGAVYYRNMCYEYVDERLSWEDAEASCQESWYGNLASFQTKAEERMISNYIKNKTGQNTVWIGFRKKGDSSKSKWGWSDGLEYLAGSALWDGRRPDPNSCDMCLALSNVMNPRASERWAQVSCSTPYPYLCKYPAGVNSEKGRRQ